jgi:DNA-binding NarL/FixJ family response regulator
MVVQSTRSKTLIATSSRDNGTARVRARIRLTSDSQRLTVDCAGCLSGIAFGSPRGCPSVSRGLRLPLSSRRSRGLRRLVLLLFSSLAATLTLDLARESNASAQPSDVRIVLFDSQPLSRLGLRTACASAGYEVEESSIAPQVAECEGERALVRILVLRDASEWGLIDACREAGDSGQIIVILPELQPELVERCLAVGASGVVSADITPEELITTIDNAVSGRTLLPSDVARRMAQKRLEESERLSAEEVGWLRALARGRTVTELAREKAYSERHLHRRLKAVYARLGVAGRTEALLSAERAGLL